MPKLRNELTLVAYILRLQYIKWTFLANYLSGWLGQITNFGSKFTLLWRLWIYRFLAGGPCLSIAKTILILKVVICNIYLQSSFKVLWSSVHQKHSKKGCVNFQVNVALNRITITTKIFWKIKFKKNNPRSIFDQMWSICNGICIES